MRINNDERALLQLFLPEDFPVVATVKEIYLMLKRRGYADREIRLSEIKKELKHEFEVMLRTSGYGSKE